MIIPLDFGLYAIVVVFRIPRNYEISWIWSDWNSCGMPYLDMNSSTSFWLTVSAFSFGMSYASTNLVK